MQLPKQLSFCTQHITQQDDFHESCKQVCFATGRCSFSAFTVDKKQIGYSANILSTITICSTAASLPCTHKYDFFLKEIFIQDTNFFLFLYCRIPHPKTWCFKSIRYKTQQSFLHICSTMVQSITVLGTDPRIFPMKPF